MISIAAGSAVVHGFIVDIALTTLTKCLSTWRMAGVLSVGARRVLPGHLLRRSQVLSSLPVGLGRFQQRVAVTGAPPWIGASQFLAAFLRQLLPTCVDALHTFSK